MLNTGLLEGSQSKSRFIRHRRETFLLDCQWSYKILYRLADSILKRASSGLVGSMRVRRCIITSFILHAALITASFSVVYRERRCPLPIDFVEVSIVEESGLARFFPDALHYNGKNNPLVDKESRKQIAPKSLFLSQSSTDYMVLNSQEDNGDKRESQNFDVAVN